MEIVYFHTANSDYIRVKKVIGSFLEQGDRIQFYGAVRGNEKWNHSPWGVYSGVRLPHGFRSVFSYFLYLFKAILFLKRTKADVVIVTNEELVLIPLLARFKGFICLDAIDALDIRRSHNTLIDAYTKRARCLADLILEVEDFRAERFPDLKKKTVVVRNIPQKQDGVVVPAGQVMEFGECPFLFAYGSLQREINGIETLIAALDKVNQDGLSCTLVVAGSVTDGVLLQEFESKSYIKFLGKISPSECMAVAARSLGIFAHYRPVNLNFIMAAPNKYYEAQMNGVPLLINSECMIAGMAVEKGFGLASDYGDSHHLFLNIKKLLADEVIFDRAKFDDSWESDFGNFYKRLRNELSNF